MEITDPHTDPFASPPTAGFDPNAPELFITPPKWPKVVGIISIVFGALGLTCVGIGTIMAPFQGKMMAGLLNGDPPPPSMVFGPIDWVIAVFGILFALLLLLAGIYTASRKFGGRMAHLIYALCTIPLIFASSWNQMQKLEAVKQWAIDYPDNQMAQGIAQQQQLGFDPNIIGLIFGIALGLSWPLFCLIWFGLVKTKRHQMTGEAAAEPQFG